MKRYNQIVINKDHVSLMNLVNKMISLEDNTFFYNKEMSDKVNQDAKKNGVTGETHYALFTTNQEHLYKATVYVMILNDQLMIYRVISMDKRYSDLGITRYNLVINTFFHHFMARCLDESYSDCISITGETMSLEEFLGNDIYRSLKAWESGCNKDAPITHPIDEDAWFEFVCKLFKSGKVLYPSDFAQWLSEECNWTSFYSNVISEMENNLDYSLSLLSFYERFGTK